MVENGDKSGSRGKRTERFYAWVQTRSLRTCTGLLSILTLAARGLSSFGEDHNTRSGRLIVSKGLSSSNFNSEAYIRNFADKDGKVWHGEGGQNLPPEAPHLVVTTYDIEDLLPKPPMKPAADAVPWASSPMEGFNGRVGSIMPSDDEGFDMYSYSAQTNGYYIDFGSQTHEFVVTKHSVLEIDVHL